MKDIKVYTASVDCLKDPVLYQKALDIIPPQRRANAERMKVESGKRLSAGAGLILMAALSDCIDENNEGNSENGGYESGSGNAGSAGYENEGSNDGNGGYENESSGIESTNEPYKCFTVRSERLCGLRNLYFAQEAHGKPYLPEYPAVHFNLSHSGSRVMCITGPVEVGCDIEQIDERHIDKVIRCLAQSEQLLAQASCVDFFRIWTLKESILKLSGMGLQIPLKSFEVTLDPLGVTQGFLAEPVRLKEYDVFQRNGGEEERYCCSCASAMELPDEMIQVDLQAVITQH